MVFVQRGLTKISTELSRGTARYVQGCTESQQQRQESLGVFGSVDHTLRGSPGSSKTGYGSATAVV